MLSGLRYFSCLEVYKVLGASGFRGFKVCGF